MWDRIEIDERKRKTAAMGNQFGGLSRGFSVHDPQCVVQGAPGAQCVVQECVTSVHRDQIFKTVN